MRSLGTHYRSIIALVALVVTSMFVWYGASSVSRLQADILGAGEGQCADVPSDPVTGEKLVFCCLDELYVFQQENLGGEAKAFVDALMKTATMEEEEALTFFRKPYQSSLHERYGWKSFCGPRISCEQCKLGPSCGNGVAQVTEECDAGDDNSDTLPDACRSDCRQPHCGDGVKDRVEQCDDGNAVETDTCTTSCLIPSGLSLKGRCGNAIRERGEQCDDGNLEDGDGCSAACAREGSAGSSVSATNPSVPPTCANGIKEQGEECDDGNAFEGDGCSSLCTRELLTFGRCGNGLIEPPEECDDGLFSGPCSQSCTLRTLSTFGICGDRSIQRGEFCDDGNSTSGDGCDEGCQIEQGTQSRCGDNTLHRGEQCDDGNGVSGDGCSATCRLESALITGNPLCGNGAIDAGEECDDGDTKDTDGCSFACFLEQGKIGDGVVQHALGEQCESSIHKASLAYGCTEEGLFALSSCGDGVRDVGEACDDGASNADTPDALCRGDCRRSACGDGIRDKGEECDDGNGVRGDLCDEQCHIELPRPAGGASSFSVSSAPISFFPSLRSWLAGEVDEPLEESAPPLSAPPIYEPVQDQTVDIPRTNDGKNIAGKTVPAALGAMVAAAAAGMAWVRRRRQSP